MREDLRIYVENVTDNINSLSGTNLDNYLFDLFKNVGNEKTFGLDEENVLDLSSSRDQIDFFEEILNNIERQDDKDKFLLELLTYDKYLDSSVISYFRDKVQVPEGLDDPEESNEEPEEEQELEEPTQTFNDSDSDTTNETNSEEEQEEELEEEKENAKAPEQPSKGPAITEYEAKTAEMEQELAKLEQQLSVSSNNSNINDNKKINIEVVDFSETLNDLENFTKVSGLNKEIEDLEKYLEEAKHNCQALENAMNSIQDINTKVAFKHDLNVRKRDIEVKEKELSALKYKREIASKSAIHLNASSINKVIAEQISYTQETINAITDYINSVKNDKNNGIVENIPLEFYSLLEKANQVKNNLYEADMAFRNQTGEINVNKEEYQVAFGKLKDAIKDNKDIRETLNGTSKQNENDIDNTELKNNIEKIKEEIEKRKENIAKYYDALKDIKNVENLVKAGRTPDDLKEDIEKINNKIDSINDDKLKEELKGELNKALNPEKEKEAPEQPKDKKKDPNKWKKWVSGLAGLALGAGIIGLTPLGLPGALAIAAGTQLVKKGVNIAHEKLKNENEVTNIEKTGKLAQFKEKIKGWLKDENIVKNINWFLNGTAIGAISMGALEMALGSGSQPIPPHREEEIIAQTDPYSNVRIGDNASGLDLSKGYDQANWASQNINAESLNQAIMQDGNSIIDSVRVTKDGVTHIVDSAGKSLTEVAQQLGVNPEELVMNITNGQGAPRAWVDAAEAVGRTL